jgi:hypothetical protein
MLHPAALQNWHFSNANQHLIIENQYFSNAERHLGCRPHFSSHGAHKNSFRTISLKKIRNFKKFKKFHFCQFYQHL